MPSILNQIFFEDLGLELKTERGNRVFPLSDKSSDVIKVLQNELESLGVEDFDVCFVCIEDYFQACLEITDLLKELGAKKIYSTANRQIEEKFLVEKA